MLIVSKFKDYYDYLQGIWGVDEKRVLDRTEFTTTPDIKLVYRLGEKVQFIICDLLVEGIYNGTEFLYFDQLTPYIFDSKLKWRKRWLWWDDGKKEEDYHYIKLPGMTAEVQMLKHPTLTKDKLSTKHNCPILKVHPIGVENDYLKHPILKDYNFGSAMPPKDIWLLLSDWLGQEVIIPNNQTDKEKIVSAGFDLKTSFRKDKQKK